MHGPDPPCRDDDLLSRPPVCSKIMTQIFFITAGVGKYGEDLRACTFNFLSYQVIPGTTSDFKPRLPHAEQEGSLELRLARHVKRVKRKAFRHIGGNSEEMTGTRTCFAFGDASGGTRQVPAESEDDALLAKELNALSMEEREKLYEEVHGVNEVFQETPEFIADRILAIKEELGKYPLSKRRAFDRACFLKPSLGNDEKIYLLFLRAERFNAPSAARKLCLHFDHKWELFGEAKLPKKITLDDLNTDDMDALRSGSYIILPKKDRAGRRVGVINLPAMHFRDWKNQVRSTWYSIFNELLADEDVQKRGTIDVLYFVDMPGIPDAMLKYVRDSHHILDALPCRPCGFHVCYNSEFIRPFLSFLHMVTSKERKLRERLHFGSHLEVQYELCTFGIDLEFSDSFAADHTATFLETRKRIEAEERREEQAQEAATGVILHPAPGDVLCGRGKPYQDFPGNLRVGDIVDETVPRYLETMERLSKTMIAMNIVQQIKDSGGRFLVRRDDGWELAQDKVARGKISQALRVRALKVIRNEGLEPLRLREDGVTPSPDPLASRGFPDAISSREPKRRRYSNEVDGFAMDYFDSSSVEELIV